MKMFAVARWEYVEKIKSKAFLISIIVLPIFMIGMGLLPSYVATQPESESKVIGVFDQSGEVFEPLKEYLDLHYLLANGKPNYVIVPVADTVNTVNEAKNLVDALVLAGGIEGYIIIPKSIMSDTSVEYRSENIGNTRVTDRLANAVRELIIQRKLHNQGIDPVIVRQLTTPFGLRTIRIAKDGEQETDPEEYLKIFFTAFVFQMMLVFLVLTSGQLLVRSMLEEKSNRVIEVLVSSCSSNDLMTGKILGLSALGLTQLVIWLFIGLTLSLKFNVTLVSFPSAALLLCYVVLGYIMYAALFVAIGAPVSTEQEAQQITTYLTLVMFVPVALSFSLMQNPGSTLIKVLTFIPLMTPTMMAMRIPIHMPALWEIIGSLAVLALSALLMMWAAGKIFRVAILVYGKRPSLGDIVRYLRAN